VSPIFQTSGFMLLIYRSLLMNKIIKLSKVKNKVPLSTASIYRLIKKGAFPKQIKLSERSSGWVLEEVEQWLEEQINKRKEEV
jgi:prophage regulatory protein